MKTNHYFQFIIMGIMLFVVSSCKTTLIDTPTLQSGELTVEDAKNWYVSKYSGLRTGQDDDGLERVVPWMQTQTIKGKSKTTYIYTPILYRGKNRPGIIISDENTPANQKELIKENITLIEEGIIVYLNKAGEKTARIIQFIPKNRKGGENYGKLKNLKKYDG